MYISTVLAIDISNLKPESIQRHNALYAIHQKSSYCLVNLVMMCLLKVEILLCRWCAYLQLTF